MSHARRGPLVRVVEQLRDEGVAGGEVHLHRLHPFKRDQQAAVVVRYGAEDPDEESSTLDLDSRLVSIDVVGVARSDEKLDALCIEIEKAMQPLIEARHVEPLAGWAPGADGDADQPVFTAAHRYPARYRINPAKPDEPK